MLIPNLKLFLHSQVSDYNVPFGKKNRGMAVVDTYLQLVNNPSEEDLIPVQVVGWCIEWLQAFFLVADDIMDKSLTRRGQPCWYRVVSYDYLFLYSSIKFSQKFLSLHL